MKEFKQKHKTKRLIYSIPVIVLLLILVSFLGKGVLGMYSKVRKSNALLNQEKIQLAELEERNKQTEKEIEYSSSEIGREDYIRREYNLALSGESVIVVLDPEKKEDDNKDKKNLWQRFLNLFK